MIDLEAHPKSRLMDEAALPSDTSEPPVTSAKQEIIERHLSLITPEVAKQVDIEMGYVENWAAFRAHNPIVALVYGGESLDLDVDEMRDTVILPAYREQQANLVNESHAIAKSVIPSLQGRLKTALKDAQELDRSVTQSRAERAKPQPDQRIASALESYERQAKGRHKDVRNLTGDIQKSILNRQIKDATVTSIEHFIAFSTPEEMNAKVEAILLVAKKAAMNEVIGQIKSDMSTLDPLSEGEAEQIAHMTYRVQTLEAELALLEELHPTEVYDWSKQQESAAEPMERLEPKKEPGVRPIIVGAQEAYAKLRQSRFMARGSAAVSSVYALMAK